MNDIYFKIYILITALSILTFTILRCYTHNKLFDILLYPNDNNILIENKVFLIYHIIVYFLIGVIFGYGVIYPMIAKIIIFETYLFFIEYCDIFQTSKPINLVITIIIALFSFLIGCFCSTIKI